MRLNKCKRLAIAFFSIYVLLSGYAAYKLFSSISQADEAQNISSKWVKPLNAPKTTKAVVPAKHVQRDWDFSLDDSEVKNSPVVEPDVKYNVEIWGKAAISMYLWQHVLEADVVTKMSGVWSYGLKQIRDIRFSFRTGPGVVPGKVPEDVTNLVLILNGREQSKIDFAKIWLDYLPNYKNLKNTAVMLLGNEYCDNDWIKPYLAKNGGLVEFVFIVYDSPEVDDYNFYQWPLGVATYRNFPKVDISSVNSQKKRYFWCNFMGTIYANSSRESLVKMLQDPVLAEHCYVKTRMKWWPSETAESQADYIHALLQSDYTLNPAGMNPECYRIYEAMSYGSIPIIEDTTTSPECHTTSYQLLREYHAPVVFIRKWSDLKGILETNEEFSSQDNIIKKRQNVLEWYAYFKRKMRDKFVRVIRERFFQ